MTAFAFVLSMMAMVNCWALLRRRGWGQVLVALYWCAVAVYWIVNGAGGQ